MAAASLCTGWTVRDVAAHLTLQQLGPAAALGQLVKWQGSLDRTIAHVARSRAAALTTEQTVAEIRATIGSRRCNVGVTHLETLCDILVHGQDIAIPLGRHLDLPADAAAVAAGRTLSMRWPPAPPSAKKTAGFRLAATDISWSSGDGPTVHGPMAALLLVCCGRLAVLPQLSGDGATEITTLLTTKSTARRPKEGAHRDPHRQHRGRRARAALRRRPRRARQAHRRPCRRPARARRLAH